MPFWAPVLVGQRKSDGHQSVDVPGAGAKNRLADGFIGMFED